jgi:hypothetical protein
MHDVAVEVIPGIGVALARIGERRVDVEQRVGPPMHPEPASRAVYDTSPMLTVDYTSNDLVESVQVSYAGDGGEEARFDGVQLTYRLLDEVVSDLTKKGYVCTPYDIGFEVDVGFSLFSMHSLDATELDPMAGTDRTVVEGVAIAARTST